MLANRLANSTYRLLYSFKNLKLNQNLEIHILKPCNRPSKVESHIRSSLNRTSQITCEKAMPVTKSFTESFRLMTRKLGLGFIAIGGLGLIVIYYGLGYRVRNGSIERNSEWSLEIKERINTTYGYYGASLFVTLCSAISVANSPTLIQIKMRINPLLVLLGSLSSIICCGSLVRWLPYEEDHLEQKHMVWVLYAGLLGGFVAPMILISGPLMIKAAWYTAGIISAMSLVVEKPPEGDDFFVKAKPLFIGLLGIFFSSVGSMFIPKTTKIGLNLYRFTIYGGFLLFGLFVFYDTHRIILKAERSNDYYDPLNESLSIYLNTLNILMRVAILIGQKR